MLPLLMKSAIPNTNRETLNLSSITTHMHVKCKIELCHAYWINNTGCSNNNVPDRFALFLYLSYVLKG